MTHLLYHVGTREPQIQNPLSRQHKPLKEALGDGSLRKIVRSTETGLFEGCRVLHDLCARERPNLHFPILEKALAYAQRAATDHGLNEASYRKLRVILVATGDETFRPGGSEATKHHTYWAARLAQDWLLGNAPETECRVVGLAGDNLHLYWRARPVVRQAELIGGILKDDLVLVCTSPGLPSVNQAILYEAMLCPESYVLPFQVSDEDDPEAAPFGVAETDLLTFLVSERAKDLISRHDYSMAHRLLKSLPLHPRINRQHLLDKLEQGIGLWELRIPKSIVEEPYKAIARTHLAIERAQALFDDGDLDEAATWLSDIFSQCWDLLRVLAAKSQLGENWASWLTKRIDRDSIPEDIGRTTFPEMWQEIAKVRKRVSTVRNNYVHRHITLETLEESQAKKEAHNACSAAIEGAPSIIDKIAKLYGHSEPGKLRPELSFRQLNERLMELLNSPA